MTLISVISVFRIRDPLFHDDLWNLTLKSYRGLLDTADQPFELIVIDNASHSDIYAQELKRITSTWNVINDKIQGFRLLRFEEHQSLAKAWNVAIGQADGEYILEVNNDIVYYESGWMNKMIELYEQHSDMGIVGVQHMSWYKWAFVEGCIFMFPNRLVNELKLGDSEDESHYPIVFDEQFTLSCEDVDFNARVQAAGYQTVQVTNPALQPLYLQHLGHRTMQTMAGTPENIIDISHENRIRLCRKYGYDERIID